MLGQSQTRMLVLVRPDRDAARLQDRLGGDLVEWGEAIGHALLIDDGMQITVPKEALDRIVKWIDTYATHEPQLISVPGWTGPMTIAGPSGRSSMVETPVWVGDTGLFGIVTEPPRAQRRSDSHLSQCFPRPSDRACSVVGRPSPKVGRDRAAFDTHRLQRAWR